MTQDALSGMQYHYFGSIYTTPKAIYTKSSNPDPGLLYSLSSLQT